MADFYTRTLGMVAIEDGDDFVVLESSAVQLVLHSLQKKVADQITISRPPQVRENAAIKPSFIVKSLRLAREAAIAAGGSARPVGSEWRFRGHTIVDGCDPEGNVIQFRQSDG